MTYVVILLVIGVVASVFVIAKISKSAGEKENSLEATRRILESRDRFNETMRKPLLHGRDLVSRMREWSSRK